jgi:hypothetical protein
MKLRDAIGRLRLGPPPRQTANASVDAVNRRDWPRLRTLLIDDFFFTDGEDNRIESADRYVASLRAMIDEAPDFRLDIDSFEAAGSMVYMRGRTVSENRRFSSQAMWRAKVERGRLVCLENYRPTNSLRLSKYAQTGA